MGIAEYIGELKGKYRQRQADVMTKREEKIKVLKAERETLQKQQEVRKELAKEKAEVRNLRTAPIREKLSGLKGLADKVKQNRDARETRQSSGPFGGGGSSPFSSGVSGSPFANSGSSKSNPFTGGVNSYRNEAPTRKPKPKKRSSNITIVVKK